MSLMSIFKKKQQPSAGLAKERLKIILEHSNLHGASNTPAFLNQMRQEILDVVKKYIDIDPSKINTTLVNHGDSEVLEVNVILPEDNNCSKKKSPI